MREIVLYSICMENFRSFREPTQIDLSPMAGLKFLSGANQVEPRLGANGAGKSTLWDALAYCLYGSSVKGVRASDLVTWGEKQPIVSTHWNIDGEAIIIERRGSPNLLTINEVPVEQSGVDNLIGLSRARFLQSVIFGQSVPLFIDLAGPERGVLLDEVLDLGLWLKAAERASQRHAEIEKEVAKGDRAIAFAQGKLEGLESTETIQAAIDNWQAEQDQRITEAIQAVDDAETELAEVAKRALETREQVRQLPDLAALDRSVSTYQQGKGMCESEYRRLFHEQQAMQKRIEFYRHSRVCDTCMQTIDPKFTVGQIDKLSKSKNEVELAIKTNGMRQREITSQLDVLAADRDKLMRKREFFISQKANVEARHAELERLIESAARACELMLEAPNPHVERLERAQAERKAAALAYKAAQSEHRKAVAKQMRMDFWKAAFRRVRLFIVKRKLAQLEVETAAAAAALGLVGWRIYFATELETKAGTLRPGIHIIVSSPFSIAPWEAWSGGEGQRIRLAVALGLASMIQRMAGVSLNFEVWDEPTAHLGAEGIDDLFECLRHRVFTTGKSIWICDHGRLSQSAFTEIWQATKTEMGSSVKLISNQAD